MQRFSKILRRRSSQDYSEPILLDTSEQEAIIEKFKVDCKRTNKFHRNALQFSGLALAFLKLFCCFLQIIFPWVLPMHQVAEETYSVWFVVFLEIYSSTFVIYFSLYIKSKNMQKSNHKLILLIILIIQLLFGLLYWWPQIIVPLWFTGGSLMYGCVILYSDKTLKSTEKEIEQLRRLMYPFKKL